MASAHSRLQPTDKRVPSSQAWSELFLWQVDRSIETPLFRQIYGEIRAAVLDHRLPPGTRLPSTRALADRLGVSRTAAVSAYEQLLAEGYLVGRVGAGTYVSDDLPAALVQRPQRRRHVQTVHPIQISDRAQMSDAFVRAYPKADALPFARGRCIMDERSVAAWRRLTHRALRSFSAVHLGYSDPLGLPELRSAICEYLRSARAVHCDPDQIVVTAGTQYAIDIALRVLLRPGDAAWIEDPHYSLTYQALRSAGVRAWPIPVDRQGLNVAEGVRTAPQARAVFVTPSHQHPLGVVMSMGRRLELLAWARGAGAWIVEDDCDGEFRYAGRPLAALQGLDDAERVIYVGTFNKVLFPGLRMGYAVVPRSLLDAFVGARFLMDRHAPTLDQTVLAAFLNEGHFAGHIRRTRLIYKEARDTLVGELTGQLGARLETDAPEQGMHLVAYLKGRGSDTAIERQARARGVVVRALSPLYLGAHPRQGLVLGFTGFPQTAIRVAVEQLGLVLAVRPTDARRTASRI